ncbi:MarR family transcriptional regulator [Arthrobacter oryzae]|uniref:MarR family transcriptional regulator n=1 Tax=Arthrobacter oryzae TaxID=409290 RepID=UPI00273C8BC1|nr:MarR family transcriptional regulator [Arthrobacter oryzae]WLQ05809.1 MarR family transcriptional regulator [Arthrobacter oryzae]
MVNRPIGYWVKRLDSLLEKLLDATLASLSLTRRQWQVLTALRVGALAPADVEVLLRSLDSGGGGGVQERDMAALVRKRLVVLVDGRLSLAEAGSELHLEVSRRMESTRSELTAGIGTDEYAIAVSVLERITKNADRLTTG